MLKEELIRRALPTLPKTREEMIEIIDREMYGTLPAADVTMTASEPTVINAYYANRTVTHSTLTLTLDFGGGKTHSFPVNRLLHNDGRPRPTVILNNFEPMGASRYFPIEELSEYDVNFIALCYKDRSAVRKGQLCSKKLFSALYISSLL